MEEDWSLIEASFLKQYGIRLRSVNDMPYSEFCSYLSGIMPDTPLGNIVSIRSETNEEVIKNFTQEQRRIKSEWEKKQASTIQKDELQKVLNDFQAMFKNLAGGGEMHE